MTNQFIIAIWLIFLAYWIITALGAKKKVRGNSWWRGAWFRAVLLIGAFQLQRLPVFHQFSQNLYPGGASSHPMIGVTGVILCATGIAFAIWARRHLGRNWGMPMSLQEGHELVTTGPYARVRHPIYTGILFAMLGSALAQGVGWLPPFLIFFVYFIYSAKTEETLMMQQFPNDYPAYKERSKMLIPFVW